MRKVLLASAAVAALLAGPTLAIAQNPSQSQQPPAASSQPAPKGSARDEKGQKASQAGERKDGSSMNDKASNRSSEGKSNAGQKSGASDMKRDTTGQAPSAAPESKPGGQKSGASDMQKSGSPDMKKDKKETTGQSQGTSGAQGAAEGQKSGAEPKASSTSPKKDRATSGQSSDQTKGRTSNPSAQPGRADQNPTGATGQSNQPSSAQGSSTSQGASTNRGSNTSQGSTTQNSTGSTTAANPQVQTKFNEVIEKQKVKSVTNVNFSVSVGTPVPRSVRVYDVPRDIVTIYPEYRGKKFVVVRDEIVIIEPSTHKVVTVIPRSGRTTTGATTSTTTSSRLQLAPEKRRMIRETVIKEQSAPRCSDVQVQVGSEVSRSVRLLPFPEVVVHEVPEIRSYQFCIKGNDVVLVDPGEHRIVEVID